MKKNILIMIDTLNGGGAEKVLKDILFGINIDKYNIDILLINKVGVYLDEIEKKYKVISLMEYNPKNINNIFVRKVRSFLFRLKCRIITNEYFANKLVKDEYDIEIAFLEGLSTKFIGNRNNKAKKIAWIHIDLKKHRLLSKKNEMKLYKKMDKIIAVSNDALNSFKELYPICDSKVDVIYNPIDSQRISNLSKLDNNIVIEKNDRINFISLGRLHYQKGYDILLRAHKELKEEGYLHNIYILGEGNEKVKLEKYIKKESLEDTVKLLGFKSNPYPYILQSDVVVSSSRYEGFSLFIAESLVLGKPIVATRCVGPNELLRNGEYGILIDIEDVESLKENMKKMILNKELREYYSNKSSERAKIFNMNETINQIEYLFDNV